MEDKNQGVANPNHPVEEDFIATTKSAFAALLGEVSIRNTEVQERDQYIYGDLLSKVLDIPVGHDITKVNWLRRTVEIHRSQFMGRGFAIDSSFVIVDPNEAGQDEDAKQRIIIENERRKAYAAERRRLIEGIMRDNGEGAFWAGLAENASAVGTSVVKAWYDDTEKKYIIQPVEAIENVYALWSKDDYRKFDAIAYIRQISKQEAIDLYGVPETVETSPLGSPLIVFSSMNSTVQYRSTQAMVTVMEVTGKVPGWCVKNGNVMPCTRGQETELNAIFVGNTLYQLITDEKAIPKYYIFPNKRARRRPWGISDITKAAIDINLTYIEALSDWRTVASKVNFTKFKAFGFPLGVQLPKPKARTVEFLPLADGQDIQPINMGQSAGLAETDFRNQLNEMMNQFVREVGISRQLFDMPDTTSNSNPATLTSMKSVSDITNAKRELWEPIIKQICEDALHTLAAWNADIAKVVNVEEEWHIKISWPSALNADDPSYHAMKLNQFNTGLISVQTLLEELGYDTQELERIRSEMEDPLLASIHGHQLGQIAAYKLIPPGTPLPPKVNVTLRGDMTPEQEANLAYQRNFNDGPFGSTMGPQGQSGLTAQSNNDNKDFIQGRTVTGGYAVNKLPNGQVAPQMAGGGEQQIQQNSQGGGLQVPMAPQGQMPELINNGTANRPGVGIMSQPGSGAPATSAKGKMKQMQQRMGH